MTLSQIFLKILLFIQICSHASNHVYAPQVNIQIKIKKNLTSLNRLILPNKDTVEPIQGSTLRKNFISPAGLVTENLTSPEIFLLALILIQEILSKNKVAWEVIFEGLGVKMMPRRPAG